MKQKQNGKVEDVNIRELSDEELDSVTGGVAGPERKVGTNEVKFEKPVYDPEDDIIPGN